MLNLRATFVTRLWEAFKQALWRAVRAALLGLIVGFALVEGLAALLNVTGSGQVGATFAWPPSVFVNVIAALFALMMAYLLGFTVAVKETFHGLVYAAEHVDDAVAAVANEGLNIADAVVDAVDGPNRHGFTGRRDPATAEAQRQTTTS